MTQAELRQALARDIQSLMDRQDPDIEFKLKVLVDAFCIDLYDHGLSPFKLNIKTVLSHVDDEQGVHGIRLTLTPQDARTKQWVLENSVDMTV